MQYAAREEVDVHIMLTCDVSRAVNFRIYELDYFIYFIFMCFVLGLLLPFLNYENLGKKSYYKKKAIFQLRGWSVLSFFISKLIPEKLGGAAHQMS